MLDSLLKIGEWQSQGKSKWDRFLEKPKVDYRDLHDNEIRNYVLYLTFDLDLNDIIIDSTNLYEYNEDFLEDLKAIRIQGGNNKAIYVTVPSNKLNQLYKTFFGKENIGTFEGEISEAIKKENYSFETKYFVQMLEDIFALKEIAFNKLTFFNERKGIREINSKVIDEKLNLANNERIVLITIEIKSKQYLEDTNKKLFSELPDYINFLEHKFIPKENVESLNQKSNIRKLCYASGQMEEMVEGLSLSSRFSLNKMFVEETKNYATNFDRKKFSINYQVSKKNQEKLDYASGFLLKEKGLRVKIANIDHVVIPQFPENKIVDIELAIQEIRTKADLLFSFNALEHFVNDLEDEVNSIYWLNFLAYESDGNFFKSTEIIKDVSSYHFKKILIVFNNVHWDFKSYSFLDWNNIMTEFGRHERFFNFNSVYSLIPIRKDKEKKNKALELFKTIFENRLVNIQIIFNYFCELILCHYFERYNSYTNIPKSSKDYFSKSIRESVFKYLAFIQVLKKLKVIDMKKETELKSDEKTNKYDQAISEFFTKMQLNQHQQAMFYLGRMLNAVEFIQKGKKKTVIEKVNFNGLDKDNIQRLRNSLVEKAKQYGQTGKIIFTDSKFAGLFDFNNWKMNPQEAVFFMLSGYSFGITNKQGKEIEETENNTQDN